MNKFTTQMKIVLEDNYDKTHWSSMTQDFINSQLRKKEQKLHNAVCKNDHTAVKQHSVDLANYAYFLYDNACNFQKQKREIQ